ncbi:GGDEF domain-containing protein [Halomonas sp. QHL1]|uniref:sensor domain-containing diguanylate cyclase n=1 Tax=Halomonas sp. QHL1 TaxID=1123773 RepID=UPI0020C92A43|nr:diguanylate cyclase [Halomonas sp. QHL1]
MNESFNQVLATAEFPLLGRYLKNRENPLPYLKESEPLRDLEQLGELFNTLLTHFGRYTRLALIDASGREQLVVTTMPLLPTAPVVDHSTMKVFQEAMELQRRDLYVSPPHLGANGKNGEAVTTVIDIATPVFDNSGDRLGVLLFTLDWSRVTAFLLQERQDDHALALLVDAQGTGLLSDAGQGFIPFNHSLADHWPGVWQGMALRNQGEMIFDKHLLWFRSHDVRTNHYRSQAGMIMSQPDTQPWRLGIVMSKPSLTGLLVESRGQLIAIVLVYLLSVAFGIFWVLSDYRLRHLRQRALQFSREARQYAGEVQDLYENAPCGYHSLDSQGRIVNINRTELDWLGYRADEITDQRCYRDFITPETRGAFDDFFQQVLTGQEGSAECELLRLDGTTLPVAVQATAHVTQDGFQYTRATVFDLSERKQLEARLAQQALTDPLTGLGNRRFFEDQAAMEMARAQRSGAPLSLIAIDLDHFKHINDTYGHDVGDKVLQAFANTARAQLRDGDVLCRIGGEEFAVLLPDTSREQAMQVAGRLRQSVEVSRVEVDPEVMKAESLTYTASLGVTLVSAKETSLKPAIKRADQGLYAAKEAGRNQVYWRAV